MDTKIYTTMGCLTARREEAAAEEAALTVFANRLAAIEARTEEAAAGDPPRRPRLRRIRVCLMPAVAVAVLAGCAQVTGDAREAPAPRPAVAEAAPRPLDAQAPAERDKSRQGEKSSAGPAASISPGSLQPEPPQDPAPGLGAVSARALQGDGSDSKTSPGQEDATPARGSGKGTEYTWNDGDRTLRVYLQSGLVARTDGGFGPAGGDGARSAGDLPVFSTRSGSLMTLPGGVLLILDPEWGRSRIDSFFAANGIARVRASALDYAANGFFVETDPGFASLNLANRLSGQTGVEVSSPNWRTDPVAR